MFDVKEVRDKYLESRYLREATDEALQQRLDVIGTNLWSTGRDGEVTQPRDPHHRRKMLELYTHVICEKMVRTGSGKLVFDEAAVRLNASAKYVQPRTVQPITFGPDCYAKFGKKEFILPALTGKLFIQPANAYNDPSLNAAQIDDELEHHVRAQTHKRAIGST